MNSLISPYKLLSADVAAQLRSEAEKAESQGNLTDLQWDLVQKHRWLNMYVPKELGGLEMTLPEILRVEEALSWADGSVGWVVTLCSGAAWFVGFLEPSIAGQVFANKNVCFAGSGAVTGSAHITEGGYIINGKWPFATGSLYATVFTANCTIYENDKPVLSANGTPEVKAFLLMPGEVKIHKRWSAMGMIGTGTHAMEVVNQIVPVNRSFVIQPDATTLPHLTFRFPFLALAELTLAANISGMAFRFIELIADITRKRNSSQDLETVKQNENLLENVRREFYKRADLSWQELEQTGKVSHHLQMEITRVSRKLVETSRTIVNTLYPLGGLEAANKQLEVNRVWRNFHTAGQHSLFRRESN